MKLTSPDPPWSPTDPPEAVVHGVVGRGEDLAGEQVVGHWERERGHVRESCGALNGRTPITKSLPLLKNNSRANKGMEMKKEGKQGIIERNSNISRVLYKVRTKRTLVVDVKLVYLISAFGTGLCRCDSVLV